jgi:hypothetical protein
MLLSGSNPIFAALVIGTIVAAITFSRGRDQRTKMILGGVGIAVTMVGLAILADAMM